MAIADKPAKAQFVFLANHQCLDFVNTQFVDKGKPVELLGNFADLVHWSAQARLLDPAEAEAALQRWDGQPEGVRAFAQARVLRAALKRMADELARGQAVDQTIVDVINRLLRQRTGYAQLVPAATRFEKRFHAEVGEAVQLLVPIAEGAADLLSSGDLSLVKQCAHPACVFYFYDTTKNHARRWCSMTACGNRAKVAAHHRRRRFGSAERPTMRLRDVDQEPM